MAEGTTGGSYSSLILLVVLFAVMYFLMIRPQNKKDKAEKQMRNNLQVGDEIMTVGGIYGKIVRIREDRLTIASGAEKTKLEITKSAVSAKLEDNDTSKEPAKAEEKQESKVKPSEIKRLGQKKEEAAPAATNLVGVSMPTKSLQRWIQDGDNMKAQLEAAGYEVDLQYAGDNDIPTQVAQCQNMIASGAKVLVIAAIDGSSLGTVLDEAKQAGVAVIAYDRLIMNSDAVTYYASFDNYKVGTLQGTYIETALNLAEDDGKTYNIEFCAGDPGDNNAGYFFNGAYDVLGKYVDSGKLVNVSGQHTFAEVATEGWSTPTCQARVENIINSFYSGTQLDAVCCSNDSTALGAINAIAANYNGGNVPVITGQDCDKANVPHIIDGTQSMAVFKDTRTLAERTVKMINSIMSGSAPETNATYPNGTYDVPSYLCDPIVCTADNYKEVLLDSGYYTAADIGQ